MDTAQKRFFQFKKIIFWILTIGFIVFVSIGALILYVFKKYLPVEVIKPKIEQIVSKRLQVSFSIGRMHYGLTGDIIFDEVVVNNPKVNNEEKNTPSTEESFCSNLSKLCVKKIAVRVQVFSLLRALILQDFSKPITISSVNFDFLVLQGIFHNNKLQFIDFADQSSKTKKDEKDDDESLLLGQAQKIVQNLSIEKIGIKNFYSHIQYPSSKATSHFKKIEILFKKDEVIGQIEDQHHGKINLQIRQEFMPVMKFRQNIQNIFDADTMIPVPIKADGYVTQHFIEQARQKALFLKVSLPSVPSFSAAFQIQNDASDFAQIQGSVKKFQLHDNSLLEGEVQASFHYHLSQKNGLVKVNDSPFGKKSSIKSAEVQLAANKPQLVKLVATLDSHDLNVLFKNNIFSQGAIDTDLTIDINAKNVGGTLQLKNIHSPVLSVGQDVTITIQNNRAQLPVMPLEFLGQKFRVGADLTLKDFRKISLASQVYGDDINALALLEQMKSWGSKEEAQKAKIKTTDTTPNQAAPAHSSFIDTMQTQINFEKVRFDKVVVSKLQASLYADASQYSLENVKALIAQGSLQGRAALTLEPDRKKFDLNAKLFDIKLHELGSALLKEVPVYSQINGELNLSSNVENGAENYRQSFLQNLSAKLLLNSQAGKIVNSILQRGMLNGTLSPLQQHLSVFEFERFSADISIRLQKIFLNHFIFDGNRVKAKVRGQLEFNGQGEMFAQLSVAEDLLHSLANPLQMGVVEQKKGAWYIFPFSLNDCDALQLSCWQKDF